MRNAALSKGWNLPPSRAAHGDERADVAVRCSGAGSVDVVATIRELDKNQAVVETSWSSVLTVSVTGTDAGEPDLPSHAVTRPCYLAETRGASADQASAVTFGRSQQYS